MMERVFALPIAAVFFSRNASTRPAASSISCAVSCGVLVKDRPAWKRSVGRKDPSERRHPNP